jgi:hypothetical protein
VTVIAILTSSTVVVVARIALIVYLTPRSPANQEGGPLHFRDFFVVSLGIVAALVVFLIAFPLVVSGEFKDPTQVIAFLSGLFGTIIGLVGNYFGVKSSGDASQKGQELARAMPGTLPQTTPMRPAPPSPRSLLRGRRSEENPRARDRDVGAKLR